MTAIAYAAVKVYTITRIHTHIHIYIQAFTETYIYPDTRHIYTQAMTIFFVKGAHCHGFISPNWFWIYFLFVRVYVFFCRQFKIKLKSFPVLSDDKCDISIRLVSLGRSYIHVVIFNYRWPKEVKIYLPVGIEMYVNGKDQNWDISTLKLIL